MTAPGLVVGAVVILGPQWLEYAARDAALAARTRRANGLSETSSHRDYVEALTAALAATRQCDSAAPEPVQTHPMTYPTVTTGQAAALLNRSVRTIQRLAPQLGGRLIGGRWLLDDEALREHIEGGATR